MRRRGQSVLAVLAVSVLIGILGVMQLRTQSRLAASLPARSAAGQAQVIAQLVETNAALRQEIENLEAQVAQYRKASPEAELEALVNDLNRLKIVNGLAEVSGPGVEIWIRGELSAAESQDLLNQLLAAGAEALSLNGQRLVAKSVVNRTHEGLVVNDVRLAPPYLVRAIGNAKHLADALEQKGGYLSLLRVNNPNLNVSVLKAERLVIPLFRGEYTYRFARPLR